MNLRWKWRRRCAGRRRRLESQNQNEIKESTTEDAEITESLRPLIFGGVLIFVAETTAIRRRVLRRGGGISGI
jgi:hypothetical protein